MKLRVALMKLLGWLDFGRQAGPKFKSEHMGLRHECDPWVPSEHYYHSNKSCSLIQRSDPHYRAHYSVSR